MRRVRRTCADWITSSLAAPARAEDDGGHRAVPPAQPALGVLPGDAGITHTKRVST